MAKLKAPETVTVELTTAELSLIRVALKLVKDFGDVDDWDAAGDLLADLAVGE